MSVRLCRWLGLTLALAGAAGWAVAAALLPEAARWSEAAARRRLLLRGARHCCFRSPGGVDDWDSSGHEDHTDSVPFRPRTPERPTRVRDARGCGGTSHRREQQHLGGPHPRCGRVGPVGGRHPGVVGGGGGVLRAGRRPALSRRRVLMGALLMLGWAGALIVAGTQIGGAGWTVITLVGGGTPGIPS